MRAKMKHLVGFVKNCSFLHFIPWDLVKHLCLVCLDIVKEFEKLPFVSVFVTGRLFVSKTSVFLKRKSMIEFLSRLFSNSKMRLQFFIEAFFKYNAL